MPRASLKLLGGLLLLLVGAPSVSAAPKISDPGNRIALTDANAYWTTTRVSGCKGCTALYKTRLADRITERISLVRHGKISALMGGGKVVAYRQTFRTPSGKLDTSVRMISDSGARRTAARARYHLKSRVNCGRQVGPLAVSQSGAVAWFRLTAADSPGGCRELPSRLVWGAQVSSFGTKRRQLIPAQPRQAILLYADEAEQVVWMDGFTGRYGLISSNTKPLREFDFADGSNRGFAPDESADEIYSVALGPAGQIAALLNPGADLLRVRMFSEPLAFGHSFDIAIDANSEGGQFVKWCGPKLLLAAQSGRSIILESRASDGTHLGRAELVVGANTDFTGIECNSHVAIVRHFTTDNRGAITGSFAPVVALP